MLSHHEYETYLRSRQCLLDFESLIYKGYGKEISQGATKKAQSEMRSQIRTSFLKARSASKWAKKRESGEFEFAHYIRAACEYIQAEPVLDAIVIQTILGHDLRENNPRIKADRIEKYFGDEAGNAINEHFTPGKTFSEFLEVHFYEFWLSLTDVLKRKTLQKEERRIFEKERPGFLEAKHAYKELDLRSLVNSRDPRVIVAKSYDRLANLRDTDIKILRNGASEVIISCQHTIDILLPAVMNISSAAYISLVTELTSLDGLYRLNLRFGSHAYEGSNWKRIYGNFLLEQKNAALVKTNQPIWLIPRSRVFVTKQ